MTNSTRLIGLVMTAALWAGVAASPSDVTSSADSSDGYYESENCDPYLPHERGLWTQLAPIESTGTWLRRGFWYAETDAVIYNRLWERKDQRFAAEDQNVTVGPFFNPNPGGANSLG